MIRKTLPIQVFNNTHFARNIILQTQCLCFILGDVTTQELDITSYSSGGVVSKLELDSVSPVIAVVKRLAS